MHLFLDYHDALPEVHLRPADEVGHTPAATSGAGLSPGAEAQSKDYGFGGAEAITNTYLADAFQYRLKIELMLD